MSSDEQRESAAEKTLGQKVPGVPVVWGAEPTFGKPTDPEIKSTLDYIHKMASGGNSMIIEVRKEMYAWLEEHLEGAILHGLGDTGQNKVRIIVARTDEDVKVLTEGRERPEDDSKDLTEA